MLSTEGRELFDGREHAGRGVDVGDGENFDSTGERLLDLGQRRHVTGGGLHLRHGRAVALEHLGDAI